MIKTPNQIRRDIVHMAHYSHASHIGAALSCADVLYAIYKYVANITPENIASTNRDRVILSKGHASIALYSVLAELGLMDKSLLDEYYINGGKLPGHLDKDSVPGIDCSAGSLGHGLPVGIGMALANPDKRVFVVMGDGETNEGSVWEGIIFAGCHKIPNLTIIIDNNNLQGFGCANECADYSKLSDTLNNFGLCATDIDGHDTDAIVNALNKTCDKTLAIVAHTIKGRGVSFMENELKWHYKSPNDEELAIAMEELK